MAQIDQRKFQITHRAFKDHMQDEGEGVPFTGFGHRFFVTNEVSYKQESLRRARDILQFPKWEAWSKKPGRIVGALKEACKPNVSFNLMEHRYGEDKNSYSALYRLTSAEITRAFESQIRALLAVIQQSDDEIEPVLNDFSQFLQHNKLGCKWDFVAYLLFAMRPERFFPIRSSKFETVLRFWGIEAEIQGAVQWERYKLILDTADALKSFLLPYGTPTAIELQSYMWVVSYLIPKLNGSTERDAIDFADILKRRQARDAERQRIGLLGEQYVFESERKRLAAAGKKRLAVRVHLVSADDDSAGYDVLSFDESGEELHIEVKTTSQSPHEQDCFWLSENELQQAKRDGLWRLWRVWNIDAEPQHQDLGNIVRTPHDKWELSAASWIVRRSSGS